MKKIITLLMLLLTNSVYAADKTGWTGFYAGGSLGVSNFNNSFAVGNPLENFDQSKTKGAIGLDVGYNLQFNKWVMGVELNYLNLLNNDYANSTATTISNRTRNSKIDNILTLTPKIGYALDNWMIYGKAGYARGDFKQYNFNTEALVLTSSASKALDGRTAGFGMNYKISNNFTAGLDYSYIKFSNSKIILTPVPPYTTNNLHNLESDINLFLLSLNYHF